MLLGMRQSPGPTEASWRFAAGSGGAGLRPMDNAAPLAPCCAHSAEVSKVKLLKVKHQVKRGEGSSLESRAFTSPRLKSGLVFNLTLSESKTPLFKHLQRQVLNL